MNRQIKFRGKNTETGEWRFGYYAKLSNEFKEWHCIMTEKDASSNYIKDCNGYNMLYTIVDPDTIGQFTGFQNKNGVEIYEGDICECDGLFKVIWYEPWARFAAVDAKGHLWYNVMDEDAKYWNVIGNIHDNPELLKGGEE